jgi:HAD superfamily hydrolase (TIGR01458 family)
VLLDIDGVLTVSWRPIPGAVEAVAAVRAAGYPLALVTNTSSRTRDWIAEALAGAGFPVAASDIFTVAQLTAAYLAEHYPGARCLVLNDGDLTAELPGVAVTSIDDRDPDVIVLGAAGPPFDYPALNRVFAHLRRGKPLVAMNANLFWQTSEGLRLDTGFYLSGLERAAGVTAEVTGKPAPAFFRTALAALGAEPVGALMVGDDLEADVLAAQRLGMTGVLVKTGKYQAENSGMGRSGPVRPDFVLGSVADLPDLLGGLSG